MKTTRAFTLIELLMVMAIIAILASLTVAVASKMMNDAENSAAAVQIQKVLAACEKFKGDFGAYPGELSALKTRDTERQKPAISDVELKTANSLATFLFLQIPGTSSKQNTLVKGTPSSWYGDYLTAEDISEKFIDDNGCTILDYWQERPLVYWLRYKNNASTRNGTPQTTTATELKKKLTPEIWSYGGDGEIGGVNCLQINAYPDLQGCVTSSHTNDTDNVGGDMNTIKK